MLLACSSVWESYYFVVTVLEQMQILPGQYMGTTILLKGGNSFSLHLVYCDPVLQTYNHEVDPCALTHNPVK